MFLIDFISNYKYTYVMRKRFKIPLAFITSLLMLCIGVFIIYYIYLEVLVPGSIEVDAPLSINYINNKTFSEENYENINFDVTNNGVESEYFFISFNQVETNYDAKYVLTSDKDFSTDGIIKNEQITEFIIIEPGETHSFILNITYEKNKILSGEIEVSREDDINDTFNEIIISNNEVKDNSVTTIASQISTSNEGLIKNISDEGTIYYFRGNVVNNYVSFADELWRIVRINSDGSVKMILNGEIGTMYSYYTSATSYEYNSSNVKDILGQWYSTHLEYYSDYISNHSYCNDNSVVDSLNGTLAPYNRANIDMVASFSCLGEKINLKIGLLTIDEALFAGLSSVAENNLTYLNNDNIVNDYYLMSGSSITEFEYRPFIITPEGKISESTGTLLNGIRPVINLSKNITVSGIGTIDNPYIVSE